MSTFSKAYILPIDPKNPSDNSNLVPEVTELWNSVPHGEKLPEVGTTRIFYNIPAGVTTALSSLGEQYSSTATKGKDGLKRELVRKSVGSAVKAFKGLDALKEVTVDASTDPHAAGELIGWLLQYCIQV